MIFEIAEKALCVKVVKEVMISRNKYLKTV